MSRRIVVLSLLLLAMGFATGWAFGALRQSDEHHTNPNPNLQQQRRLREQNRELERQRDELRAEGVEVLPGNAP